MELKKGKTDTIIQINLKRLQLEGFSKKDAVAIAYSKAGKKRPKFVKGH